MCVVYKPRKRLANPLVAATTALFLAVFFFLLVPIMHSVGDNLRAKVNVDTAVATDIPPPDYDDPPPEDPDEKQKEDPPELEKIIEDVPLRDLIFEIHPGPGGNSWGPSSTLSAMKERDILEIFRDADLDERVKVLVRVKPIFPYDLRNENGKVIVEFVVSDRGKVLRARAISSSNSGFEAAAIQAIKRSKWRAGTKDGKPVNSLVRITVLFNAR